MTKGLVWLLVIGCALAVAWSLWRARRRMEERQHAEDARAASFLAQAIHRPAPAATTAPEEKLLFDAAVKAAEAGEPALSIQLCARLIARFPSGALVAPARAAAETQKKKLATARAPDTSGPG